MPALTRPKAAIVDDRIEPRWLADGVGVVRDRAVVLAGQRWVESGPDEGLAIIACLTQGRLHESLVRLDTADAVLVKAAFLLAFGWSDGITNDPLRGLPPRGRPVRVELEWTGDDGRLRRIDASCLVRDRDTDRALPPLPFLYTGSRTGTMRRLTSERREIEVASFKLAEHHTVIAAFDADDALLSTPLPFVANDLRLEVNTGAAPPARTPIRLVCGPAELPLMLVLRANGSLARGAEDAALDDAALTRVLAAVPTGGLRAVGITVAPHLPRSLDRTAIARVMDSASAARTWLIAVMCCP